MNDKYKRGFIGLLVFLMVSFFIMNLAFVLIALLMHPFFNWVVNDVWEIKPFFMIKRFLITVNLLAAPVGILLWIQNRFR